MPALFLQAVPFPTNDTNAWVWIAGTLAIAIGVVFLKLDASRKEPFTECKTTLERCYTREDKIMEENKLCVSGAKDLLTAVLRSADIAESAVELHRGTDKMIEANRLSIEDVKRLTIDIQRAVDEMRRAK